jgi:hypothetical protein
VLRLSSLWPLLFIFAVITFHIFRHYRQYNALTQQDITHSILTFSDSNINEELKDIKVHSTMYINNCVDVLRWVDTWSVFGGWQSMHSLCISIENPSVWNKGCPYYHFGIFKLFIYIWIGKCQYRVCNVLLCKCIVLSVVSENMEINEELKDTKVVIRTSLISYTGILYGNT